MSTIAFNQLLGGIEDDDAREELRQFNIDEKIFDGIPTDVRRDIFAGETVSFKPLALLKSYYSNIYFYERLVANDCVPSRGYDSTVVPNILFNLSQG